MPKKDNIIPFPTKEEKEGFWGNSILERIDYKEAQQELNEVYRKLVDNMIIANN